MPYTDPEQRRQYLRDRRKTPEWKRYYHDLNVKQRRSLKDFIAKAKDAPCMDCGGRFHFSAMDFDHRDPSTKSFGVSNPTTRNLDKISEEIAKCDLVCSNCHRVREWKRKHQT